MTQPANESDATREFVPLYMRHQRAVYVYIRSMLADPRDVEEVWQETNLVLWKKFSQFEPGTNFVAWACQIARFEVLSHYAKRRADRLRFSEEVVEKLSDDASQTADDGSPRLDALRECLAKLPASDRQLIERRYADADPNVKHLAAALGRPVRGVYKTITRIRRALLDCIERTLERSDRV